MRRRARSSASQKRGAEWTLNWSEWWLVGVDGTYSRAAGKMRARARHNWNAPTSSKLIPPAIAPPCLDTFGNVISCLPDACRTNRRAAPTPASASNRSHWLQQSNGAAAVRPTNGKKSQTMDSSFGAPTADNSVGATAADNSVGAPAADNSVGAPAADNSVRARAADNSVRARAADDRTVMPTVGVLARTLRTCSHD